jgi:hypothetical protein
VKVRLGKGMAKPIGFVSPRDEEKKRNMDRKKAQKEEMSIRLRINFSPFQKFEGIILK